MPYNKEKKIIFIHIPKCAGTTIAKALDMYGNDGSHTLDLDHLYGFDDNDKIVLQSSLFKYYKNYLPIETIQSCFVFGIVRNPYDRILSDYSWSNRGCNSFHDFVLLVEKTLEEKTDEELMIFNKQYHWNHYLPQYKYIENDSKQVDVILHYETLEEDFHKHVDETIVLPHCNKSKHEFWKDFFSEQGEGYSSIPLLNKLYHEDFVRFNYDKL